MANQNEPNNQTEPNGQTERNNHGEIEHAARVLAAGGTVVFPTDTVYGVGVSVCAAQGPDPVFRAKNRPSDKPLIWFVASVDEAKRYARAFPAYAEKLVAAFWPGALTIIVPASDAVQCAWQSGQHTIGLRMPASAVCLALLRELGCPIAQSSANLSGNPAPTSPADLDPQFLANVDFALAIDEPCGGVASTIVDCTGATPVILREGAISVAAIEATL